MKARQAIKATGSERQVSASSAKNVLALVTLIDMGTTRSGVDCLRARHGHGKER